MIVAVPPDTPVTSPVFETVATPVADDVQGLVAAGVPEPVNCVVAPAHALNVPVIVGRGLTVKLSVLLHPPVIV